MKKIGIIGGMSYESSLHYYERINRLINQKLGDLHAAEIIMYSVNFQSIEPHMRKNDWEFIEKELCDKAQKLENAGADFIVIATNTMHKLADKIQNVIHIPLLHIADCVANESLKQNVKKVGLLGTKYTMTEKFLRERLEKNGLEVYVPEKEFIDEIDRIIFKELCKGIIKENSKEYYLKVIERMIEKYHIDGVILGCTEIEMLIESKDVKIPIFDTTQAHINASVEYALEEKE